MSRNIRIDREKLRSAIAVCRQRHKQAEAAELNLPVLCLLWAKPNQSAASIAIQAQCSRAHVFNVVRWVNANALDHLFRPGKFRKKRLSGGVRRSSARRADSRVNRELKLTARATEQLKQQQCAERSRMGISPGELRPLGRDGKPRRRQNPVLRIAAVILLGTTASSITEVSHLIGSTRRDVRRWLDLYRQKGIRGLCTCIPGGRPQKRGLGARSRAKTTVSVEVEQPLSNVLTRGHVITSRDMVESVLEKHLRRPSAQKWEHCSRCHVFLHGVRGSGKTSIVKKLFSQSAAYFDCEKLSVQQQLQSPQEVLQQLSQPIFIFDEVGQLVDPHRVVDTALSLPVEKAVLSVSSTSGIAQRNQTILYAEKCASNSVRLLPLLWEERQRLAIQLTSRMCLEDALVRPGLPGLFLGGDSSTPAYHAWTRFVFEHDVRHDYGCDALQFLRLMAFIMERSGQLLDSMAIAEGCGIERGAAQACVESLKSAGVIWPVPMVGCSSADRCKLFASDSGLVHQIRNPHISDRSRQVHLELLWKHLVLLQLRYSLEEPDRICSWLSSRGDSVDFTVETHPGEWAAIQCDWAGTDNMRTLAAFRRVYPRGINVLVSPRNAVEQCSASGLECIICPPAMAACFLPPALLSPYEAYRSRLALVSSTEAMAAKRKVQGETWRSKDSAASSFSVRSQTTGDLARHYPVKQMGVVYRGIRMEVFHMLRVRGLLLACAARPNALGEVKQAWQTNQLETLFVVKPIAGAVIGEEVFTQSVECDGHVGAVDNLVGVFGCPVRNLLSDRWDDGTGGGNPRMG